MKTIFDKSVEGRKAVSLPALDVPKKELKELVSEKNLRTELRLPELSEIDVVRHYTALSKRNFGVDLGFYPLGSCTMKYNPKVNEKIAAMEKFTCLHPLQPTETVQGALQLMFELEEMLCEICGMDAFTLQPAAGAHGELTGIMLAKNFFELKGEKRSKVLLPDSSHGTNPASSSMCCLKTVEVKSDARGNIDLADLKSKMDEEVAVLMLTNPNTLGLFDEHIEEVCRIVHEKGGLVYCDGANLNALLGKARPGDIGFDLIQLNLHKTFSTPHGGGGPGSGPVGVKKFLAEFLPVPRIKKTGEKFEFDYNLPNSIGKVKAFYGNFNVMVKAFAYIRALGADGLKKVAENAVLNANYLKEKLQGVFDLPFDRVCMHEFVLSDKNFPKGITTNDLAKRLLDFGFHAPTVYFPLIVHGAIMIEPTETENKETLDAFAETMLKIAEESEKQPDLVRTSPHNTPVKRLDAVKAARELDLRWKKK